MICRHVLKDFNPDNFDYFNDYQNTLNWLRHTNPKSSVIGILETGYEKYLKPVPKSVADARKDQTRAFVESIRGGDSLMPRECDTNLNDSCRDLIKAMGQEGEAWLGKVNLYGKNRTVEGGGEGSDPIWLWDGSQVCNFDCSFAIPCDDEQLRQMILDRDRSEYTGTADDYDIVKAIHDRIEELGGHFLIWS